MEEVRTFWSLLLISIMSLYLISFSGAVGLGASAWSVRVLPAVVFHSNWHTV